MKTRKALSLLLAVLLLLGTAHFAPRAAAEDAQPYAAGDIIEYGSYPQSLVTDEALLAVLPRLLGERKTYPYYGNEVGTGEQIGRYLPFEGMTYVDVVYQGVRYRGVSVDAYRPFTTPGGQDESCQAQNGYPAGNVYWFRFEPLRWRVLDPDGGLVMCDTLVDSQPFAIFRDAVYASAAYTGEYGSTTDADHTGWWETISVWLNGPFLTTAFSEAQRENILAGELVNDYWFVGSGAGGNGAHRYDAPATADRIFLPAWDDLCGADAGFGANGRTADAARTMTGTDYAKAQGLLVSDAGTAEWWTRTVSRYYGMRYDCVVGRNGAMTSAPANLKDYNAYYGVCPAMRLETIRSDAAGDVLPHTGDLIRFGSYPQSRVADAAVVAALNERLPLAAHHSLDARRDALGIARTERVDYADMIVDGVKYRAKIKYSVAEDPDGTASQTVYSGCDHSYTDGNVEKYVWYYRFEPLTWRILDPESGLLMCNEIIESLVYQSGCYYDDFWGDDGWADEARTRFATDYTISRVRDYLIHDFLDAAFNDSQRAKIAVTAQDNRGMMTLSGTAGYERYDWETTDDAVFLLSSAEALNPDYGFDDETRKLQFTAYALESRTANNNNYWVLRNAADMFFGRRPCGVFPSGHVGFTPAWSDDLHGVVPAIYVTDIENEPAGGVAECGTHTPVVVPTAPASCTEPGCGREICAVCGETLNETVAIPPLGHDVVLHEGKAPTCGAAGWAAYETCTRCDYTTRGTLPPTGAHDWTWVVDADATCSAPGVKHEVCAVCGAARGEGTAIPATGAHVYTDAVVKDEALKSAAACGRNAVCYYSCRDCGCVEYNDGHTFEAAGTALAHVASDWIVDIPATCQTPGVMHVACTVCLAVLDTRETGLLPHTPEPVPGRAPTCTGTGLTDGVRCAVCKTELEAQKEIPASGHAYGSWTAVQAATCTETGLEQRVCARDASHTETRTVPKTAHADRDGDGRCDSCGAETGTPQADQTAGACVCGEIHTGPFAGLIRFFHGIAYFFRNLFRKP